MHLYIYIYIYIYSQPEMSPLEQAKVRGLGAYANSHYAIAAHHFTTAIELDKANVVLYSNR
jgi:hypothetical protein